MDLKFDISKPYAIALEGGGARGAYQVGAWRALYENGVKFSAVAGSSVGALNGAMMVMDDLESAEALWHNMKFSTVMDVDDDTAKKLLKGKIFQLDLKQVGEKASKIIKDGGFDVTPLKNLIKTTVDPKKIRNSDKKFYICTHSVTDKKSLELDAAALEDEELFDMLLASAYFPAFKHELLGGKMYTDGGVSNVLPLSPLINNGYKDIIAIRLYGFGVEKRVKIPKNTSVLEIAPNKDLGNMLNFDAEHAKKNYTLGYFDALRLLYGLYGKTYYIDRTLSEEDAYNVLTKEVTSKKKTKDISLRTLHEELIKFSKKSGSKGDYFDVLIAYAEELAKRKKINEFEILTDRQILKKIGLKI